ncbi:MAG: phage tail protein, partial [Thermodesulfobacteriota bacterium]
VWGCDSTVQERDRCEDFRFAVKWDGEYIPGICKVSGLRKATEVVEHREGGDPIRTIKAPGRMSYAPIILERSVTQDLAFEEWAIPDTNSQLADFRKEIVIELHDDQGAIVRSWLIHKCWVSEYAIIDGFDANNRSVAIERIRIENEGWERIP